MNCLGQCCWRGEGVEQNLQAALEWFEKGASGGNPEAQFNAAWFLDEGLAGEADHARAVHWYEALLKQALPERECWRNGVNNLANATATAGVWKRIWRPPNSCTGWRARAETTWPGSTWARCITRKRRNAAAAAEFYRTGVETCTEGGDCALALGRRMKSGQGVEQNEDKAVELARLALKRAGGDAQVIRDATALLDRQGASTERPTKKEERTWTRRSCWHSPAPGSSR